LPNQECSGFSWSPRMRRMVWATPVREEELEEWQTMSQGRDSTTYCPRNQVAILGSDSRYGPSPTPSPHAWSQESRLADQGLPGLPKAVQLAQEVGTLLGGGALLQRRLPQGHPAREGTKKPGFTGLIKNLGPSGPQVLESSIT